LLNLRIGEHFLTKLFTLADFRYMEDEEDISSLIDFHARHKLLLMYYDQKEMRALGTLVANREHLSTKLVLDHYSEHLSSALARPPRCGSAINVLMHAMGYFSEELNGEEKGTFLETLEQYRQGKVPMTVPLGMIRSWIARFDTPYLRQQSFLQPFPEEFLELMSNDACVGRDMWSRTNL
jgi:uncharacterized protein YbgA (DUF1722 family)